jgi:hypothetical protein
MHDWSRVEPTIYHHFHQRWAAAIADVLNAGLLPPGLSALIEQYTGGVSPDVLTVERRSPPRPRQAGVATLPRTRLAIEPQEDVLVKRANRVAIRHRMGEVVCIIEIVSPGNKASRHAVGAFVAKTHEFLRAGVHVLLVDPFPPGPRDPHSLHKLIWDEFEDVPFDLPADEPLLLAAYRAADPAAGVLPRANIEPLGVGAAIPDMPAWIDCDAFVEVPLGPAYQAAWDASPSDYRYLVEHGRLPDEE